MMRSVGLMRLLVCWCLFSCSEAFRTWLASDVKATSVVNQSVASESLRKQLQAEVAKLRGMEKNPLLWVPGFASNMLEAKPTEKHRDLCHASWRWTTWATTFMTVGSVFHFPCLLYTTMLQYPKSVPLCGADSPGIATRVMPGKKGIKSISIQPVAKYLLHHLKEAGYVYGESLGIANFDWRKFSLPCYNEILFKAMALQVEKLFKENNNTKVIVAGHSLGAMVSHRFLAAQPADWKRQYIQHFLSLSGPLGGTPAAMQVYLEGPHELLPYHPGFHKFARATVNSWAGFLATLPNKYGGETDEDYTFIQVGNKSYTVKEVISGEFFKDRDADTQRRTRATMNGDTCAHGQKQKGNLSVHCRECLGSCAVSFLGDARCKVKKTPGAKWSFWSGRTAKCSREGYVFNPDGDTRLIEHATNWVREYETAPPPGVPTTCHGISNVKTRTRWQYKSFADKRGNSIAEQHGDGTVTVASAIGPCKRWREQEMSAFNESSVGYIRQAFSGAEGKTSYHKEALLDKDWIAMLLKLIRDAKTHSVLPDASLSMIDNSP